MSSRDHPDWWRPTGGQNSQDSILERRSLVWNDNGVVAPTEPPAHYECVKLRGKFFPRGCRGKIEDIQVYSQGPAGCSIILRISPFPGMGPVHEVTITPGLTWAWYGVALERMWNYDSLYIEVLNCLLTAEWAYDEVEPHDGHQLLGGPVRWADMAIRPYFRVVYTGETPGDVPVSGIVNTIEIPGVATRVVEMLALGIPNDTGVVSVVANGAGTLIEARLEFYTSVTPTAGAPPAAVVYEMGIYADGTLTVETSNRDLTQSAVATSGRSSVGEFYQITVADPAYDRTVLTLRVPVKFQRSIYLRIYQSTGGAVNVDGYVFANMLG